MLLPPLLLRSRPALFALRGGAGGVSGPLVAALAVTPAADERAATNGVASLAASALGYVMFAGALLIFMPMILQVARARSGAGISLSTWILSFCGYVGCLMYQSSRGYPLSTYVELLALSVQSALLMALLLVFDRGVRPTAVLGGIGALCAGFYGFFKRAPARLLASLQAVSSAILALAMLPQLALAYRTGTCGYSRITALLGVGGNAVRVFTTLQLTKDALVLVGFLGGLSLNLMLLAQTFLYPNPTAGT
jgi:uncharacterized protein with PQ loop repeat